ncbi:MAG: hypothetical protein JXA44_12960 [Methanospirillaceae archaeon]|nr:hypothetical protein [Methanospirillaceae archaeon]
MKRKGEFEPSISHLITVAGIILVFCLIATTVYAVEPEKTPLDRSVLYAKMYSDPKTSEDMKSALQQVMDEQKAGNIDQAETLFQEAVSKEMNAIGSDTNKPGYQFMSALQTYLASGNPESLNDALWQVKEYRDNAENKDDASQSMGLYLDALINEQMGRPDQVSNTLVYSFKTDPTNSELFFAVSSFLKENFPDTAEQTLSSLIAETGYTGSLEKTEVPEEEEDADEEETNDEEDSDNGTEGDESGGDNGDGDGDASE